MTKYFEAHRINNRKENGGSKQIQGIKVQNLKKIDFQKRRNKSMLLSNDLNKMWNSFIEEINVLSHYRCGLG